jgi:hypothetical protein
MFLILGDRGPALVRRQRYETRENPSWQWQAGQSEVYSLVYTPVLDNGFVLPFYFSDVLYFTFLYFYCFGRIIADVLPFRCAIQIQLKGSAVSTRVMTAASGT